MRLEAAGISGAGKDARYLLGYLTGIEPGLVPARGDLLVDEKTVERLEGWIGERISGKSVHRITGSREFFGRNFFFDEFCLEPRPETELLVERVLYDFKGDNCVRFAEIGIGSGVIALSLLLELKNARAVATDISEGALCASKRNAENLGVAERLGLVRTSCLEGVDGPFDFIVSNPPYIETEALAGLSREVREHDPLSALDGGGDGLDVYKSILSGSALKLRPAGRLYLETGHGQHSAICGLATENGWGIVSCHLDLSGLERIVVLEKPAEYALTQC